VTEPSGIPAQTFKEALEVAGDRVRAARDELCALDASAGDGDLGATLDAGFAEVGLWLESSEESDDIGAMLHEVGMQLARKAPSTIGALLGSAFMRAGKELAGRPELRAEDAVTLLEAAASGVADRGRAVVGQRTILDAMTAAAAGAALAANQGLDTAGVLRSAAVGAKNGADETATMEPVHGRAGWIAERARGTRDAGAAAWAVYVDGLAEACRPLESEQVDPA
jgi:dihydroxyacetone kinase-like protein